MPLSKDGGLMTGDRGPRTEALHITIINDLWNSKFEIPSLIYKASILIKLYYSILNPSLYKIPYINPCQELKNQHSSTRPVLTNMRIH